MSKNKEKRIIVRVRGNKKNKSRVVTIPSHIEDIDVDDYVEIKKVKIIEK